MQNGGKNGGKGMGIHNLTDRTIKSAKTKCVLRDGGGLELRVHNERSKSWVYRKTINGKRKEYGLGSYTNVPLATAREKAAEYGALIDQGIDPKAHQHLSRQEAKLRDTTFSEAAEQYLQEHSLEWSNEKHRQQWRSTIDAYAKPIIGDIPIAQLTTEDILRALKPIWTKKTETATRVRERIERIIGASMAMGVPLMANPASWKGNLEHRLPKPTKVKTQKQHPAMPHGLLPQFWNELKTKNSDGSRALQLLILTACRTSEVIQAKREEIDLKEMIWTIPIERMKPGREHVIPLTAEMISIIKEQVNRYKSDYLFPGSRYGKTLSGGTFLKLMKDMGYTNDDDTRGHYVPHGFRATFSSWAFEDGRHNYEIIEMCLSHNVGNAVHRAYQRSMLVDRRRALLNDWCDFVTGKNHE
ncbi:MAG: integrase arm-type DNA-binding domain-containing protein [Betaproteobacteria bacterium]